MISIYDDILNGGEHFTDAWIRRKEIRRYITEITYGVEVEKTKKVTLVTSDLINALSATAEGIDVIYFSKTGSDNILPRSHVLDQIVRFIILCAVLFEEIKISINNEDLSIKGIWEGKTPSEWITDSVMITR